MKTSILCKRSVCHLAFLSILLLLGSCTTGCNLHSTHPSAASNDTVVTHRLGDSIAHVLFHAERIKVETLRYEGDSTIATAHRSLDRGQRQLLKFILTNPEHFQTNHVVYGLFAPSIRITLVHRQQQLTVGLDFGLQKWNICNADHKELARYDFRSTDFKRWAELVFPKEGNTPK